MGKGATTQRPITQLKKQPLGQTIKKFFDRKVEKKVTKLRDVTNVIDLCDKEADSTITDDTIPEKNGCSRSPSPYSARPVSSNSAPLLSPAHTGIQDVQQPPPHPDSEEHRVVYKSSPTQRAPSEPPEAAPSLSGRQLSADADTLRQRLISAVQRPSGSGKAGQLAGTLSLRCLEEDRSHQVSETSTPHCPVSAIRATGTGSGTPGKKPSSRSKSSSKTPSEHVRSGSAVKRNQTLAFGSPLGSQRKGRSTPARRAKREGHKSSSGGKVGHSTAKRQKRKALMDILERVEVAVKEAKEDNTEDEGTEEAGLRKTASSSFERVSQEIERASQELPQAKQALSSQPRISSDSPARNIQPRAGKRANQAPQRQPGEPNHAPALSTRSRAEQSMQSTGQRLPLVPLVERRSQLHPRGSCSSQEPLRPGSQQSDSALSRGTTQSISEAPRPPSAYGQVSRQASGQQQAPMCVGARVTDAGHILPGSHQPGRGGTHGTTQYQNSARHSARGLQGAGPQHREQQGRSQQGSHRDPHSQDSHTRQRPQPVSQPAQPQGSGRPHPPPRALPSLAPARMTQRAPDQVQSQRRELQHPARHHSSSHAPSRPGQAQPSARRPIMQPVSTSHSQPQLSEPQSCAARPSLQRPAASQAQHPCDSGAKPSGHGSSVQPLRASQAPQHTPLLQHSSGTPPLAKHNSDVQTASGPPHAQTCVLGAALPSSKAISHMRRPEAGSSVSGPSAAQDTGVFAGKSTGVFADDEEEEDPNWDVEVAKLLENAALSRPDQDAKQTYPQDKPCFSGRASKPMGACPAPHPTETIQRGYKAAPVRYKVQDIITGEYEKQLIVREHAPGLHPPVSSSSSIMVHLQDGWMETPAQVGDVVHLLADIRAAGAAADEMRHATCNSLSGLLILQPDVLLSGTRIAGSFKCPRLSVLEERFGGDSNAKAVEGTLLHDLLQAALRAGRATAESLHHTVKDLIRTNAEKLLEVGMKEPEAEKVMRDAIPALLTWLQTFRRDEPDQAATLEVRDQKRGTRMEAVAISEVVDIEESIWLPRYGLKGMIDASVRLRCQPVGPHGPMQALQEYTAPLEFKTGRAHQSHRAQVTLYQLLMEERYGQHIERGLLWYLRDASPEVVARSPYEVAGLIIQRNVLAARLGRNRSLPPVLGDPQACSRCFQVFNCSLLHKAVEGGSSDSAGMGDAFEQHTHHMTPAHAEFLAHWLRLVDLEEGDLTARRAEIWALPGKEREQKGRCIAGLRLVSKQGPPPASHADKPAWLYCFRREPGTVLPSSRAADALRDSCLVEGDMVILSIEGRHAGVARGIVKQLSGAEITLTLDKRLRQAFGPEAQHSAASSLREGTSSTTAKGFEFDITSQRHSWRLDKDDVASVFVRLRRNLMGLFSARDRRAERLRDLIVDLAPPTAGQARPQDAEATEPPAETSVQQSGLNAEQQDAVKRSVEAQDYTLLLGMPGTGKSSTIVQAVVALLAASASVVLMSYTNSAVDNLLLKLAAEGVPFLRIGRLSQVEQRLHAWMPGGSHYPDTSVHGLRATAQAARVVGCTCLSASHPLLQDRVFDVCIMDEAGQITLPAALGAIMRARTFCLVGDHHQLPPLVQNPAAAEQGLDCSLFRRLCEAHPQAVVTLRTQYRMCADIMALANELTYAGRLRCGSSLVEQGMLSLTSAIPESLPAWLRQALEPRRRVLYLDTSAMSGGCECQAGDQLSNPAEADMIIRIVESLQEAGIQTGSIGVISPYRSQVALIQRLAKQRGWSSLEALTIDRCQGRDKDVILVSMVRNNDKQHAGKLLADERRINVALTRAKLKLVMLGAQRTLCSVPIMQRLWEYCRQKGWTLPVLPES